MKSLEILNSRKSKTIKAIVKDQYGVELDDFVLMKSMKDKVYIARRECFSVDIDKLRIDKIGMYFCTLLAEESAVRLSIEGSQMIGPKANKGVLDIDEKVYEFWLAGHDIDPKLFANGCRQDISEFLGKYVILKHNDDYLGCAKITKNKILNFVPKERRVDFS